MSTMMRKFTLALAGTLALSVPVDADEIYSLWQCGGGFGNMCVQIIPPSNIVQAARLPGPGGDPIGGLAACRMFQRQMEHGSGAAEYKFICASKTLPSWQAR